jgi:hypothetical protein
MKLALATLEIAAAPIRTFQSLSDDFGDFFQGDDP